MDAHIKSKIQLRSITLSNGACRGDIKLECDGLMNIQGKTMNAFNFTLINGGPKIGKALDALWEAIAEEALVAFEFEPRAPSEDSGREKFRY